MKKLLILLLLCMLPLVSAAPFNLTDVTETNWATEATSGQIGIKFYAYENGTLRGVGREPSCAATNVTLRNAAGTILTSSSTVTGHTFTFDYPLVATNYYRVELHSNGGLYNNRKNDTFAYPKSRNGIELVTGSSNGADLAGIIYCVNNVTLEFPNNPVISKVRAENASIVSGTVYLNATLVGALTNVVNATLYVWDGSGTLRNLSYTTTSGLFPNVTFTPSGINFSLGTPYKWNVYGCLNTGVCSFASYNSTFYVGATINNVSANASTYQTETQLFRANLTVPTGVTVSSATLFYHNNTYTGTVGSDGTNTIITKSFDMPLLTSGSYQWFWKIMYGSGENQNTTNQTQGVSDVNLTLCGASPMNVPYINFTMKNETTGQENIKASLTSSFTYYLSSGSGTEYKTLSYTNTYENASYAFCFSPQNRTALVTPELAFANSYSQQRRYEPGQLTLTNVTTNKTLYLLPNSLGSFVTFQVFNLANQPLADVTVNLSRSSFGAIEYATTSDSGTVTFFLNPNVEYTVCASKTGYGYFCTTDSFTQTSYTLTLGGTGGSGTIPDYSRGITWSFLPTDATLLNDTTYNFAFVFDSSYWDVSSFGYTLVDNYGRMIGSATQTGNSGTASSNVNTYKNGTITIKAYWIINGTYTNRSKEFIVLNLYDTDYSILNFFNRLSFYINESDSDTDGIFGLENTSGNTFNISLILFIAIFGMAGFVSYKYGLSSPTAVMGFMFALVYLFDISFSMIPRPDNGLPIATILTGLVLLASGIREFGR